MSEQGDRARGAASFKPGAKELGFLLAASNHPQVLEDLQPQEQWVMPLAPGIFLLPGCSLGAASWFPAQGLSLSLSLQLHPCRTILLRGIPVFLPILETIPEATLAATQQPLPRLRYDLMTPKSRLAGTWLGLCSQHTAGRVHPLSFTFPLLFAPKLQSK